MDARDKILQDVVSKLTEHFSSVRIVACADDQSGTDTSMYSTGGGSYFEQIGAVREWLSRQDEAARDNVRSKPGEI